MTHRPKLIAVTALAVAGLAVAGCSSSSSSPSASGSPSSSASSAVNLSSYTLYVGDQTGTGAEAVLEASGLLKTLPFKVVFNDFTSGPPICEAISSGHDVIGGVGDLPPVFAAAGGENIELVGAREAPTGDQDAVLVPKNSPIKTIQELKGAKIAYGSGTSGNAQLLTVLAKAGLTTKDITGVNLQPAEALAAFTSGAVQAWDIWPPYVQQAVDQDGARVLATGTDYGSKYSFEVASKSALQNPTTAAAVKIYLETLNKAYDWTDTHTNAWAAIWGKAAGLPTSIMDQAAKVDLNVPVAITPAVISAENTLADDFYAIGDVPTKVNMAQYSTTEFNSAVSG